MGTVSFHNADVSFRCPQRRKLRNWLNQVAVYQGFEVESVAIIFCSDDYLLDLNRTHLQHDYFTDIITFDDCRGHLLLGELYISIDRVKDNAPRFQSSFLDELHRVMVHGLLHLCGLGDKTDTEAQRMRQAEDDMLALRASLLQP